MADNQLIYKVVPTIITDNVTENLPNSQHNYIFTQKETLQGVIVSDGISSTSLDLPGPVFALLTVVPFIQLITSSELEFLFDAKNLADATVNVRLEMTNYIAGNLEAFNFKIRTLSVEEISFQWSIYTNE